MKRLTPTLLTLTLLLALLGACSNTAAGNTEPLPTPFEPSAAVEPSDGPDEPSLSLPPALPTAAPTHHPEPEETHHVEPEETHHPEPESSHHPEPEETHHPEPEETHHGDSHHGEPAEPSLSLPPDSEVPAGPSGTAEVDLQMFYDDLVFDDPDFNATAELFGEYLDVYYPGLSAVPARQLVVYQPMMSAVVCEIALVEVEDSADVMTVIELLQARIAAQVGTEDEPGGAWYPASIERWQNNSRIVSHGRYIMLIAYEKCDDVVAAFDALF